MSDNRKSDHASAPAGERMLRTKELATRWACSTNVIEKYRYQGGGCPYVKIGAAVRYPLSQVLEYERARLRGSTSDSGPQTLPAAPSEKKTTSEFAGGLLPRG